MEGSTDRIEQLEVCVTEIGSQMGELIDHVDRLGEDVQRMGDRMSRAEYVIERLSNGIEELGQHSSAQTQLLSRLVDQGETLQEMEQAKLAHRQEMERLEKTAQMARKGVLTDFMSDLRRPLVLGLGIALVWLQSKGLPGLGIEKLMTILTTTGR